MKLIFLSLVVLFTTAIHLENGLKINPKLNHKLTSGPKHLIDWGHYNTESTPGGNIQPNWMSRLGDNTKVTQLSIPGTHDSGTFACAWYQDCDQSQCQSWNIYNQLRAGIRYLDLRIDIRSDYLALGHGSVQFMALRDALKDVSRFLNENPREFVILAYQKNNGDGDPSSRIIQ
jgi:1-phosphatidylinositol phosphodiesterase